MINREATIRWKGYDPDDLLPQSNKRVWGNCEICGKGRWMKKCDYRDICQRCSNTGRRHPMYGRDRSGKNNPMYGKHHTEDAKEKMRGTKPSMRGKNNPAYGIPRYGENNPNWRGGTTTERERFMSSSKYVQWREDVFKRDGFVCQECGDATGGNLQAHHILPYRDWKNPQYSLNIMNGITLCKDCHKKTFYKEYKFFSKYFDIVNGVKI